MHPDLLARICKLVERKEFGLICFPRICFPRLIHCDQEPLLLLNVTEDYFLGVHIRLYQLVIVIMSIKLNLVNGNQMSKLFCIIMVAVS